MEITRENVMTFPLSDLRSIAEDYADMGELGISGILHGLLDEIERLRPATEQMQCGECGWQGGADSLLDEGSCPTCNALCTAISNLPPEDSRDVGDVPA